MLLYINDLECEAQERSDKGMNTCAECIHAEMCRWMDEVERDGCDFFDGDPWIPVSERLPDNEEDVLVYSCRHGIDIQYHDDTGWHDIHNDALCSETIAWMPLPEPYKADMREV